MKSTLVQYNSWPAGAGRKSYWRREKGWKMVELKDHQQ